MYFWYSFSDNMLFIKVSFCREDAAGKILRGSTPHPGRAVALHPVKNSLCSFFCTRPPAFGGHIFRLQYLKLLTLLSYRLHIRKSMTFYILPVLQFGLRSSVKGRQFRNIWSQGNRRFAAALLLFLVIKHVLF